MKPKHPFPPDNDNALFVALLFTSICVVAFIAATLTIISYIITIT